VASLSQGRTAAAQCGLFTHKSVPVIFEPPCILKLQDWFSVDIDVVQTLPVLWRHSMTCVACVLCTVQAYTLAQCYWILNFVA